MTRYLSISEVAERLSISEATVRRLVKSDPTFPRGRSISPYRIAYLDSELEAWMLERPESKIKCRADQG